MTHLSSESDRSLDEKALLHRDSERKLQNRRPSRIPIVVDEKKNKVDTKENLPVYFKIQEEEPLGKHLGMFFSQQLASFILFIQVLRMAI